MVIAEGLVDLGEGCLLLCAGTRKLDLGPNQTHTFSGNVAKDFKEAKSFSFLGY